MSKKKVNNQWRRTTERKKDRTIERKKEKKECHYEQIVKKESQ